MSSEAADRTARIAMVIPTHNRTDTVRLAVESVIAQTLCDFELVVVDDASSDDTVDVVSGVDDPLLRVIVSSRRGGANAARNRGILETTAGFVAAPARSTAVAIVNSRRSGAA